MVPVEAKNDNEGDWPQLLQSVVQIFALLVSLVVGLLSLGQL
jgi:hypothetical protein